MKIAVLKETRAGEQRVAATPDSVKKLVALGHTLCIEKGAGSGASVPDSAYETAGATVASRSDVLAGANLILKVQKPEDVSDFPEGAALVALLSPHEDAGLLDKYNSRKLTALAL